MPLILNDPTADKAFADLRKFVAVCGGDEAQVEGWRTELYDRSTGHSAGTSDRYWYDRKGRRFRSRAEIARALGLSGAPSVRIKGESVAGVLAPGESPATFSHEFPAAATEKTLAACAAAFTIGGDFREFEARDVLAGTRAVGVERRPRRWRPLLENFYVAPAAREPSGPSHEWPRCVCVFSEGGCGENCVSRDLYVECALGCCGGGAPVAAARAEAAVGSGAPRRAARASRAAARCADGSRRPCANTVIQRRAYPPMEIFDTRSDRGFGLRCRQPLAAGTMLGEYRGEVIDARELARRKLARDAADPFYIAALGDGLSVDAGRRGAYARFANHSCAPNCKLEKWRVGEEPRLVLIANADVAAKTELTYDYNAGGGAADVTVAQLCRCGAPNCAGAIGAKVDGEAVAARAYAEAGSDDDSDDGDDSDDDAAGLRAKRARGRAAGAAPAAAPAAPAPPARARWTDAEVDDLKAALRAHGADWAAIRGATGALFADRSRKQLEAKYYTLKAKDAALAKAVAAAGAKRGANVGKRRVPGATNAPAPAARKKAKKGPPPEDDGEAAWAWAAATHAALVGTAGGAADLAEALFGAATRARERRSGAPLHCYCRLPEEGTLPDGNGGCADDDALVNCDACEGWVHPRCVGLSELPGDDDPFLCPLCASDRGDGAPLLALAATESPWKRPAPRATVAGLRAALDEFAEVEAECKTYARLAGDFLKAVAAEASAWAMRADAALGDAEPPLRTLAVLVCEGATLATADERRDSALRTALRAAVAAGARDAAASAPPPPPDSEDAAAKAGPGDTTDDEPGAAPPSADAVAVAAADAGGEIAARYGLP